MKFNVILVQTISTYYKRCNFILFYIYVINYITLINVSYETLKEKILISYKLQ